MTLAVEALAARVEGLLAAGVGADEIGALLAGTGSHRPGADRLRWLNAAVAGLDATPGRGVMALAA